MVSAPTHSTAGATASASAQSYRPEVDGLRAIAVVSVIVFHLNATWLPGGFVGVDVFFVISGYLITGFVRREVASGTWAYRSFFVRRVRRLAPPLLFVTVCSCCAAYFLLLPRHMASFAKSVIAQPIALQNMHFLAEGLYFEGADTKPLLHTWSLGVEEQFYLAWPLAILLLSRFQRRTTMTIVAALLLLSFALNMALPLVSPKASFFLFPPRAWELGLGGLLAIAEEGTRPSHSSHWGRTGVAGLSLLALTFSFAWIDSTMAFPGWIAAIPVAATAALIAALSRGSSPIRNALSFRPIVAIGLISYSLYLWHWPVIVFAHILDADFSQALPVAAVLTISGIGATVSYRLVEQPIRQQRALSSSRSLLACTFGTGAMLITLGTVAVLTNGMDFRYQGRARSMLTAAFDTSGKQRCGIVFRALYPTAQVCAFNDVASESGRGILLWGNSHAGMWTAPLSDRATTTGRPLYLNARNCRATVDGPFCDRSVQSAILSFIESHDISDVVLASSWHGHYGVPDDVFEEELALVVEEIVSRGATVWLVVDVPTDPEFDPEAQYRRNPDSPQLGSIPLAQHAPVRARELALFQRLASKFQGVQIVDPTDDFCYDGERCYGGRGDRAFYRDADHITTSGAMAACHRFDSLFRRGEPDR